MWRKKTVKDLLPPPVKASHGEYSMILSAHDDPSRATPALIDFSLKAISAAHNTDLSFLSPRHPSHLHNIWPGEHYKLLAGCIQTLQPPLVIEIGTSTGLSALAMAAFLPNGKLITYDIKPWHTYPNTALQEPDFHHIEQRVGNLADPAYFISQLPLLTRASFIFIDATHDGSLERTLLDALAQVPFATPPLLLFDDIRVWTMLKMWREIPYPKLDLTSFGHWSGTGLVHLTT